MALTENELAGLLAGAPNALVGVDPEGRIVFINDRAESLFGWSSADVVGVNIDRLLPQGLPRESAKPEDVAARRRDGSEFAAEVFLGTFAADAGASAIAAIRDMSESDRNRLELEERAELFDQFARSTEVGLFLREGTEPLFMSPKFLRMLGFDPDLPYPTLADVRAMIHPDDAAAATSMMQAADRGEPSRSTEARAIHPDGTIRWFRATNEAITSVSGARRVASVFIDITDLKAAEAATQVALLEAERANVGKTEFLSRMSHELRTPLNAILGFGQLLEMGELEAGHRESVRLIVGAGEHLLELIDEVLDIARVEQGEMRLSLEPVLVGEVTTEAVEMLRPLARRRGIRIVDDGLGGDVYVRADRQRLKQVIVNLLANAVKYNRDGGEVRIESARSGDHAFRLTVSDTGIGIAEDDLGRLFQPFERLSADRAETEGTGLGLALTRHLVEVMDGTIGLTSRLGEGSVFWVEFPIAEAPEEQLAVELTQAPKLPIPSSSRRSTVLYVEDNLSNVRLVQEIMGLRPGVVLKVATHGRVAVEMALEHRPDLILLDLNLPDIPGSDVLRELKSDDRTAAIPVVIVSADATLDQPKRLLAQGASEYVTKPFDIPRLLSLIDHLGAGSDEPALVEAPAEPPVQPLAVLEFVHDLNNLLGVIKVSHDLLVLDAVDAAQVSRLAMIGDAAESALVLTRDLTVSALAAER
jgi:PAS domain S-box-containing protein